MVGVDAVWSLDPNASISLVIVSVLNLDSDSDFDSMNVHPSLRTLLLESQELI